MADGELVARSRANYADGLLRGPKRERPIALLGGGGVEASSSTPTVARRTNRAAVRPPPPVQRGRGLRFLLRTRRGAWPPQALRPPPRPPWRLPLLCWGSDDPPPPPKVAVVVERRSRSCLAGVRASSAAAATSRVGACELRFRASSVRRRALPPQAPPRRGAGSAGDLVRLGAENVWLGRCTSCGCGRGRIFFIGNPMWDPPSNA